VTDNNKLSVTIDKKACLGCGMCSSIAPNSFKIQDNVSVFQDNTTDSPELIKQAASMCPNEAIKIS